MGSVGCISDEVTLCCDLRVSREADLAFVGGVIGVDTEKGYEYAMFSLLGSVDCVFLSGSDAALSGAGVAGGLRVPAGDLMVTEVIYSYDNGGQR